GDRGRSRENHLTCHRGSLPSVEANNMSTESNKRSEEFLKISGQFQLGVLTTEASHPVTAKLSQTAKRDVSAALALLFDVDADVLSSYAEFEATGRAQSIKETLLNALRKGGKVFFTGCG